MVRSSQRNLMIGMPRESIEKYIVTLAFNLGIIEAEQLLKW